MEMVRHQAIRYQIHLGFSQGIPKISSKFLVVFFIKVQRPFFYSAIIYVVKGIRFVELYGVSASHVVFVPKIFNFYTDLSLPVVESRCYAKITAISRTILDSPGETLPM
jgi:hypothetical protein